MAARTGEHLARAVQMRQLLYGHLVSRALCTIALLGIPELLAAWPRSAEELAERVAADAPSLRQLLRAIAVFDVVTEEPDGRFALTPLGATLRRDVPASALPSALLVGGEIGQAWNELAGTIRTGRSAFAEQYGTDFFSYVELKPELRLVFHESQARGLELDLDAITAAVDFAAYRTIADVGGGDGALLAHLLNSNPGACGLLVDLPKVVPHARQRLAAAGLLDRCQLHAGDFFAAVPAGGDVYLLRQILHDWDDEHCGTLLRNCREAMAPGASLLIVELMAEDRVRPDPTAEMTALMDLYMLSIFDGKERTRSEFGRLLREAGFSIQSVTPLSGRMVALLATPAGPTDQGVGQA